MTPDELKPIVDEVDKELSAMFERVVEARDLLNADLKAIQEFKMRLTKMMIDSYGKK